MPDRPTRARRRRHRAGPRGGPSAPRRSSALVPLGQRDAGPARGSFAVRTSDEDDAARNSSRNRHDGPAPRAASTAGTSWSRLRRAPSTEHRPRDRPVGERRQTSTSERARSRHVQASGTRPAATARKRPPAASVEAPTTRTAQWHGGQTAISAHRGNSEAQRGSPRVAERSGAPRAWQSAARLPARSGAQRNSPHCGGPQRDSARCSRPQRGAPRPPGPPGP